MSAGGLSRLLALGLQRIAVTLAFAVITFFVLTSGILSTGYARIETAVAAELRDPSSAQFRNVSGSGDTYCGEVNGKNGVGAYAGYRQFIYQHGTVFFEPTPPAMAHGSDLSRYYEDLARFARRGQSCSR